MEREFKEIPDDDTQAQWHKPCQGAAVKITLPTYADTTLAMLELVGTGSMGKKHLPLLPILLASVFTHYERNNHSKYHFDTKWEQPCYGCPGRRATAGRFLAGGKAL